jgi:hypothetical protein
LIIFVVERNREKRANTMGIDIGTFRILSIIIIIVWVKNQGLINKPFKKQGQISFNVLINSWFCPVLLATGRTFPIMPMEAFVT